LNNKEDNLRPRLTDEFLSTLVEAAKVVGNSVDSVEMRYFVREVFSVAGKSMPEWKPYDEMREDVDQ
jgi:hypothetical protein